MAAAQTSDQSSFPSKHILAREIVLWVGVHAWLKADISQYLCTSQHIVIAIIMMASSLTQRCGTICRIEIQLVQGALGVVIPSLINMVKE